jgi:hypothetical protein
MRQSCFGWRWWPVQVLHNNIVFPMHHSFTIKAYTHMSSMFAFLFIVCKPFTLIENIFILMKKAFMSSHFMDIHFLDTNQVIYKFH